MQGLSLTGITKSFGNLTVIKPTDLEIEAGEFVVFVGPSGCGKSTLLRLIAGLEPATGGEITIGGKDVTHLPPIDRKVAMVFQSYALYPHMTVGENIAFGLKIAGMPKAERLEKAREAARLLQLEPLLDRKPKQLSGGQRQRVAIGRAIVKKPDIFLFDEPLSNLDAELRVQMRLELAKLHQDVKSTMIYVTHDQVEAMTLADKIVVLRDGMIEQIGSPLELYERPKNAFVAGFIGSPKMNFFDGTVKSVEGAVLQVDVPELSATVSVEHGKASKMAGQSIKLGVRPEAITVGSSGGISTTIDVAERLGNVTYIYAISKSQQFCIESKDGAVKPGERIAISIDPKAVHVFSQDGERL